MIKQIPGIDGYFASQNGEIFSNRKHRLNPFGEMKSIKPSATKRGYMAFCAYDGHRKMNVLLHRAVALTWLGPTPEGCEVCHNDGNRANCAASNLRWDTRKGNHKDKLSHGTQIRGEDVYNAKLTLEQAKIIRAAYDNRTSPNWGLTRFARDFGVHPSTVNDVAKRRTWQWITF